MRWLTVSFCCLVLSVLLLAAGAALVMEDRFPLGGSLVAGGALLLLIGRLVRHHGPRR